MQERKNVPNKGLQGTVNTKASRIFKGYLLVIKTERIQKAFITMNGDHILLKSTLSCTGQANIK